MGGGGDDGTAQLRADEAARQAKIQAAVDAINGKFGIAPAAAAAAPSRDAFMNSTPGGLPAFRPFLNSAPGAATQGAPAQMITYGPEGNSDSGQTQPSAPPAVESFDQAGYDAAMKAYQDSQSGVASAKAAREALYSDIGDATTQTATRDLDKQFTRASDQNIFGLARAGLSGGSVDAESGGDLQSRYGEGKIRAKQAGIGAASDLKSVDEKTRQNLIGLAQSGIDTGTAASLAAGQSAAAADVARANTAGASIGQLFDNMGQAYLNNRVATAQYPNGLPQQSSGSSFFGNLFTGKGYSGKVTA